MTPARSSLRACAASVPHRSIHHFAPLPDGWSWAGPGVGHRYPLPVIQDEETVGPPTFQGASLVLLPCSSTPVGPVASCLGDATGAALADTNTKAPTTYFRGSFTQLRHSLPTLRSGGLPRRHARLASRLPATLYRVGHRTPRDSLRKVSDSVVLYIIFLLSLASWRKVSMFELSMFGFHKSLRVPAWTCDPPTAALTFSHIPPTPLTR